MSSLIKKIGTVRLDKDMDIEKIIHFGKPENIRVAQVNSGKDYNLYELYVEKPSTNQTKKENKKNA